MSISGLISLPPVDSSALLTPSSASSANSVNTALSSISQHASAAPPVDTATSKLSKDLDALLTALAANNSKEAASALDQMKSDLRAEETSPPTRSSARDALYKLTEKIGTDLNASGTTAALTNLAQYLGTTDEASGKLVNTTT